MKRSNKKLRQPIPWSTLKPYHILLLDIHYLFDFCEENNSRGCALYHRSSWITICENLEDLQFKTFFNSIWRLEFVSLHPVKWTELLSWNLRNYEQGHITYDLTQLVLPLKVCLNTKKGWMRSVDVRFLQPANRQKEVCLKKHAWGFSQFEIKEVYQKADYYHTL